MQDPTLQHRGDPGLSLSHLARDSPVATWGLGTWAILFFSPGAEMRSGVERGFSSGRWAAWSQLADCFCACWARW